MKTKSRFIRSVLLVLIVIVGILAGITGSRTIAYLNSPQRRWLKNGKLAEYPTYLVYLPDGYQPQQPYPLVFALSPSADALSMITAWSSVADRHHWVVAASKEFQNGVDWEILLPQVEAELNAVEGQYAIDPGRVIFTGLSGGGMGAHAVSKYYPSRVSAVVINTGMMEETFMTDDYPPGKLAVFLASPTDFRYQEMHRDRDFLELHHWKTKWIEFSGGHIMAPAAVYEQAAEWLEDNFPK